MVKLAAMWREGSKVEMPPVTGLLPSLLLRLDRVKHGAQTSEAALLYGEWLRRERRRTDARVELRMAHELFSESAMEAFAERARVELAATGERSRKRTVDTLGDLTPQETQISRLVAEGNTNREIAAQLFLSASTVSTTCERCSGSWALSRALSLHAA